VSAASSPALIIRFSSPADTATRDRLVEILSEHDLLAIHEDDLSAPRVWTAHFASPGARDAAAAAITGVRPGSDPGLTPEPVDVEDEDWARRTQADLPAIRVGRVVVAPPWDRPEPQPGELLVEIEPSRGFGTGHHQSTRLCLALLQDRDLAGRTGIDVGTGSGVLAIVCAKLGAAFVSAIDVDPDAVDNARENVDRNQAGGVVEVHVRDLTEGAMPAADVVTANLTGTLLVRHAAPLTALVKPGGALIVSGFTIDEKPLVLDAFEPAFDLIESAEEDDWWAFMLTRRS
jgi:ribosomal protein L11 methyltransferase